MTIGHEFGDVDAHGATIPEQAMAREHVIYQQATAVGSSRT